MPPRPTRGPQKRALFYVFDGGTGMGHLRRIACIARRLQGRFACLIVTGHRSADWFVPEECEYVHLPSWDSLFESRSRYWGRTPFVDADRRSALRLRREILHGVVRGFRPDALFVDHLPLGAEDELASLLKTTNCRRYLVTRGVMNETEDLGRLILGGKAMESLRTDYHRIFAAMDPRVFDFLEDYRLHAEIGAKTLHTGYVADRIRPEQIAATRAERGVSRGDLWVVASAGGGQKGERLIAACLAVADAHPTVAFDVVVGPRSSATTGPSVTADGRVRVHRGTPRMPLLNASADLVISTGGYNTLLEAAQGSAKILCFPFRTDSRDEPRRHAGHLARFVDLEVSVDLGELPARVERALAALRAGPPVDRRSELDLDGAAAIERVVAEDVGLAFGPMDRSVAGGE